MEVILESIITSPNCGFQKKETKPEDVNLQIQSGNQKVRGKILKVYQSKRFPNV
jgi:hypothetical protein